MRRTLVRCGIVAPPRIGSAISDDGYGAPNPGRRGGIVSFPRTGFGAALSRGGGGVEYFGGFSVVEMRGMRPGRIRTSIFKRPPQRSPHPLA